MYSGLHLKHQLFLSDVNQTWFPPYIFEKKSRISNFIKIRPAGAEFFHADGQTDMTKLIYAFRNFANAHKHPHFTHTLCSFDNYDSHAQHRLFPSDLEIIGLRNGDGVCSLWGRIIYIYRCPGRNVPDFGRMFLKLKYTDITKNTYIRSWTITEIKAR